VDFVELSAEGGLKRGERWVNASAGLHHLLAVTNKGRAFSLPLSPSANTHRQLGTRQIFETPFPVASSLSSAIPLSADLPPESDPRFVTQMTEIPSLAGIAIEQVAASDRTSFMRTPQGRVLGFGANESGQIGLGSNAAVEIVPVPVEVVLARNYAGGTSVKCLDIQAGGQMTMFTVERNTPGKGTLVELLACGNGMNGALGNGLWSSAAGAPVRVKTVSGLTECRSWISREVYQLMMPDSEKTSETLPLGLHKVSLSKAPTSHVFAVLDTVSQADIHGINQGIYGKDVMVWGGNGEVYPIQC
jgi:alpha-tubulin suppressor-like RCC1 family protein